MVQQVALEIPEKIIAGLLSGDYIQYGGVVRDTAGKLVALLKEVPLPKAKNYKTLAIGLGAVAVVSVAGLVFLAIKNNKDKKKEEVIIPECVEKYNKSLCIYLEAVRNGKLDITTINGLISDLDTLKENYDNGKITIEFSTEQLDTLLNLVFDYTKKLAEANAVKLNEIAAGDNTIIGLRHYLEVQKQIFEQVA